MTITSKRTDTNVASPHLLHPIPVEYTDEHTGTASRPDAPGGRPVLHALAGFKAASCCAGWQQHLQDPRQRQGNQIVSAVLWPCPAVTPSARYALAGATSAIV